AKKTIAKAEEYLAFESLYTAATVATLKTAVADLVDGDYADAEDTQFLIEEVEAAIAGLQNAVTYYTLSGNNWNDVTKNSFYSVWDPDLELVTGTNAASYTWNTKDPELPVNDANQPADANTKEMIDGFVNAYGTNTKWDANYYNTILFDLGEKSIVDRVDIAHHIYGNAASYMLGEVVVQTSLDGNHYISAVSGQGDPTAANVIHVNYDIAMDSFSFAPRAARYVRVTFKKLPSAHSVRPMEIAVFGYEDPDRPYISNIFGEVNENNTFGAIEFDACFQNYDKRDVEEFGIYVYKDGNTEEGIKKYISENATIALKTNQGIFSTIINNIPAEKFHEKIFAMPYVIIEGKSYRGTASSASVNDFQHN
ncbi:MAG: discoidin domain-containing protein, partial [Ruminococcaceae bacterium]|nr:discoidin domain-containing protein [Oscillospiraceae bacterium]